MSVKYGTNSRKIKNSDIDSVTYTNLTILETGEYADGGYYIKAQPDSFGCGGPESKISITLKDNSPWTKVSYQFYYKGSASCWSFNQGGYYGMGNILSFNSSLDRVFNSYKTFDLSGTTIQMTACDNDTTTNIWRRTTDGGSFYSTRRRDTSSSGLASINVGLSCNSSGAGYYFIIDNIFVF